MSNPTNEPTVNEGESLTPFDLVYNDASKVTATETSAEISLTTESTRTPVKLHAKVKEPLKIREVFSALYSVVASDLRYAPRDRTAYAAYLRMKKETSHLAVWQAQQAYFSWLSRNDPLAFIVLDPIISVHPDRISLEVFSKDESTYANLSIDRSAFEDQGEVTHGTTNIDFSPALFTGIQQMRDYRQTEFHIGQGGVGVATTGAKHTVEKKIPVPDSWLRGFLQVQSAATLPMDKFTLSPLDLYNLLRHLRMHSDIKGKRRGLRIELVPGQTPRMVLEPWETLVESSAGAYHGKASRVVRVWGRRRLMLIRRFLPFIKTIEVNLLGNGLPSFWIFRGEGVTLTMGLTGFTNANWSQAVAFDLLLPRKTQDSKPLGEILKFLGDVWFATPAEIGKQTGLKGAALTEALQAGCQQGKLMYDLAHGVYRLRPLSEKPIDFTKLEYRNVREKQAYDLMTRRHAVDLVTENRIPGSGLEIIGKVSVSEDGRDYRPMLLLGDEGQVLKAECTCSLFRKQGLKNGPCAHLIALRLIHAKREADRKKGSDSRQTITTETRAYTRRTEDGEESRLISLEKTKIRVKWGKTHDKQRQITLRFNSESEARESYFAQVEELDKKGYLAVAGD